MVRADCIRRACAIAAMAALTLSSALHAEAERPPNIILYLADDLGYGSIQPFGADPDLVQTTNLANLANAGIAFDHAYTSASVCSPTRYGILTGRYSWRTHLKSGVINMRDPLLINPERATLGRWLQSKGYRTAQIGKWHLGYKAERNEDYLLGQLKPGPIDCGFNYSFALPNNLDDGHKVYTENYGIWGLESDVLTPYGLNFYGNEYIGYDAPQRVTKEVMPVTTQRAVDWISDGDLDQPFFLYYCAAAVHRPIVPSDAVAGTSSAGAYGDFIHDVDHSIGQLMAAVNDLGIADDTIIIFTSDNGAEIPPYNPATDDPAPENIAIEAGLELNGPLRGDKHTIWEGGFKVPTIISWPGTFAENQRSDAFITTIDFFATITDIVTGEVPAADVAAPDSISFAHVLTDPSAASRRFAGVFRDSNGRKALRMHDWKYIDNINPDQLRRPRKITAELYDIISEPYERTNLADANPSVVSEAKALLADIIAAGESRALCSE